jgi:hypothetical protein
MKTLKDLKEHSWVEDYQIVPKEYTHPATQTEIVEVDELKANAVKCAKFFKRKMEGFESVLYWKGRFDEIMERFDLTEEDIEEKKQ